MPPFTFDVCHERRITVTFNVNKLVICNEQTTRLLHETFGEMIPCTQHRPRSALCSLSSPARRLSPLVSLSSQGPLGVPACTYHWRKPGEEGEVTGVSLFIWGEKREEGIQGMLERNINKMRNVKGNRIGRGCLDEKNLRLSSITCPILLRWSNPRAKNSRLRSFWLTVHRFTSPIWIYSRLWY